jgi:hypothetical protein
VGRKKTKERIQEEKKEIGEKKGKRKGNNLLGLIFASRTLVMLKGFRLPCSCSRNAERYDEEKKIMKGVGYL